MSKESRAARRAEKIENSETLLDFVKEHKASARFHHIDSEVKLLFPHVRVVFDYTVVTAGRGPLFIGHRLCVGRKISRGLDKTQIVSLPLARGTAKQVYKELLPYAKAEAQQSKLDDAAYEREKTEFVLSNMRKSCGRASRV